MNIGEQIINEIVKQGMVQIAHPDPNESHVLVWKANAADQLSALISARGEHYRNLYEEESRQVKKLQEIIKDHTRQWAKAQKIKDALDETLSCSNGHYNPLFKCACYQHAHDLVS